jgi:hypothetical protein
MSTHCRTGVAMNRAYTTIAAVVLMLALILTGK